MTASHFSEAHNLRFAFCSQNCRGKLLIFIISADKLVYPVLEMGFCGQVNQRDITKIVHIAYDAVDFIHLYDLIHCFIDNGT